MNILAAVGKAVGDGMTLAAEILCPRDHTVEDRLRSWESASEAVEDEICDEADWLEYGELTPEVAFGICPTFPCTPACHSTSAAVSTAADPSPTVPSPSPASVGGEGRKEDSCILLPASFRQPTCVRCDQRIGEAALVADQGGYWCSVTCAQLDQEADPGVVTSPAPGDGRPTSELLRDAAYVLFAMNHHDEKLRAELCSRADMFKDIEQ